MSYYLADVDRAERGPNARYTMLTVPALISSAAITGALSMSGRAIKYGRFSALLDLSAMTIRLTLPRRRSRSMR